MRYSFIAVVLSALGCAGLLSTPPASAGFSRYSYTSNIMTGLMFFSFDTTGFTGTVSSDDVIASLSGGAFACVPNVTPPQCGFVGGSAPGVHVNPVTLTNGAITQWDLFGQGGCLVIPSHAASKAPKMAMRLFRSVASARVIPDPDR